MSDDMFRCICYTCGEEKTVEEFEDAQRLFNDHADSYHEVELFNLNEVKTAPVGDLEPTGTQIDDPASADE